jgi:hypothetical protein
MYTVAAPLSSNPPKSVAPEDTVALDPSVFATTPVGASGGGGGGGAIVSGGSQTVPPLPGTTAGHVYCPGLVASVAVLPTPMQRLAPATVDVDMVLSKVIVCWFALDTFCVEVRADEDETLCRPVGVSDARTHGPSFADFTRLEGA